MHDLLGAAALLLVETPGQLDGLAVRLERAGVALARHVLSSEARASDRRAAPELDRALEDLAARPGVARERLAAIGVGRGGTLAFLLGCRHALAAVVDLEGPLVHAELSADRPTHPLELVLNLEGAFLGVFARSEVRGQELELLRTRLDAAARTFDILVEEGPGGFFDPANRRYDARQAGELEEAVLAFLRAPLAREPESPPAMSQYLTAYDLTRGKTLAERYTIEGAQRQSGFAVAHQALGPGGSPCEVTLFPAGMFDGEGQLEEFRARVLPWLGVESPHVLRVREVLPVPGGLLFATDRPPGEPLREHLDREKRLGAGAILRLGRQLLEGLITIHAAGLVHGDIKPRTIHVEGAGERLNAMLVDGGVTPGLWSAKGLGEKTALIGTPYYAPMEQFGGDRPDVRSDVYNLATVLYECATGVLPWTGTTFLEVFQSKLNDPPPMRSRAPDAALPPALEAAILHGCLADRRKRCGSAVEFLKALERV